MGTFIFGWLHQVAILDTPLPHKASNSTFKERETPPPFSALIGLVTTRSPLWVGEFQPAASDYKLAANTSEIMMLSILLGVEFGDLLGCLAVVRVNP